MYVQGMTDSVLSIYTHHRLAGTMDYLGDITQGEPIAQKAVELSKSLYGPQEHPVTALCLTNYV